MPQPMRKVNPGAPFEPLGETHNALVDAAQQYLAGGTPPPGPPPGADPTSPTVVRFRNDTGRVLGAPPEEGSEGSEGAGGYWPGVIVLGDPIASPADKEALALEGPIFAGEVPDVVEPAEEGSEASEASEGSEEEPAEDLSAVPLCAICLGPVADGGLGWAVKQGFAWVRLEVTDESHTHSRPKDDTTEFLTSSSEGIRVHSKDPAPSSPPYTVWAVVELAGGSGGGGGGVASLAAVFAIVTEEIGPATGDTDEITPGSGMAQFYTTDEEGVRTKVGDPKQVLNYDPGETYSVGTGIYTTSSAGGEVVSAFCTTFDEPEESS